ncbi:MAG: hypothetical protein HN855_12570 [Anaerolineae bacterium]|nr:hypothetical protein [Anaerolineae bacterium]MBT7069297.1 hypothetical protein [Anaerolineae bacterium]MBT7325987.1 hypothetical protein [Anaerolineae bacterium]
MNTVGIGEDIGADVGTASGGELAKNGIVQAKANKAMLEMIGISFVLLFTRNSFQRFLISLCALNIETTMASLGENTGQGLHALLESIFFRS